MVGDSWPGTELPPRSLEQVLREQLGCGSWESALFAELGAVAKCTAPSRAEEETVSSDAELAHSRVPENVSRTRSLQERDSLDGIPQKAELWDANRQDSSEIMP